MTPKRQADASNANSIPMRSNPGHGRRGEEVPEKVIVSFELVQQENAEGFLDRVSE